MRGLVSVIFLVSSFAGLAQNTSLYKHFDETPTITIVVPVKDSILIDDESVRYLEFSSVYTHHLKDMQEANKGKTVETVLKVGKGVKLTYMTDLMQKLRKAGSGTVQLKHIK